MKTLQRNLKTEYDGVKLTGVEVGQKWVSAGQQGVIITVTDKIVGNTVVKGFPNNVLDENGKPVIYEVPLYEVRVSGNLPISQ